VDNIIDIRESLIGQEFYAVTTYTLTKVIRNLANMDIIMGA